MDFETIMKIHNLKSGITIKHLNDIMFYLKKTLDYSLQIGYLLKNPFNFIKEEKCCRRKIKIWRRRNHKVWLDCKF